MRETFEEKLERNPLRNTVRENFEVRPLRAMTDRRPIGNALHLPCGNGDSTSLIRKHFSPMKIAAVDRDARLVSAARERHRDSDCDFSEQDLSSLGFSDAGFDAVFDLADLHNIRDWRRSLAEFWRVLTPGGVLLVEELSRETFEHGSGRLFRRLTEHPYDSMFSAAEFIEELGRLGFVEISLVRKNPLGLLRYFLIAARKPRESWQAAGSRSGGPSGAQSERTPPNHTKRKEE